MQSLKIQKLCGYIIYIKSVVASLFATFLFCSGIWHCASVNRTTEIVESTEDVITKGLVGCANIISSFVGFAYLIIALVIALLSVLYLRHGRRILYSNNYEKKYLIIALVVECICSYALGEYMVSSIFMGFRWELIFIFTVLPLLIGQSFFTIYLITKTMETHKKEQEVN